MRVARTIHSGLPFLALAAVVLLPACRPPVAEPVSPPRHLLLITVDTLRADHTGLNGYVRATTPFLVELGARSTVFERAIAQWPKTGASFASLFSGRYPQSTGLTHRASLRLPQDLPVLAETLRAHGFTTVAAVSNPVLSIELGWSRGFDEYAEVWGDEISDDPLVFRPQLYAGRVNQVAEEMLARHRDAERLFAWIHYSDPHAPYVLPDGTTNPFLNDEKYRASPPVEAPLEGTRGKRIGPHTELAYYVAQYDANVLVVDRAIEELVSYADHELGLLDEAAIVFTADHGESLGEHGSYFEHGPLPYNTTSHVPLLIALPNATGAGVRVQEPVELVDLAPTILALLGLEPSAQHEGSSLAPLSSDEADESGGVAFAESGRPPRHDWSVQDQRWKLVYRLPRPRAGPEQASWELYDLRSDPGETRNLAAEGSGEQARLRAELLAWRRDPAEAAERERVRSEAERRALEALGYVEEVAGAETEGR